MLSPELKAYIEKQLNEQRLSDLKKYIGELEDKIYELEEERDYLVELMRE